MRAGASYEPSGLPNLGNSCYIASALQCLACLAPELLGLKCGEDEDREDDLDPSSSVSLTDALRSIHMRNWRTAACETTSASKRTKSRGRNGESAIASFKRILGGRVGEFAGGEQCDAFDLWAAAVQMLHEEKNDGARGGYKVLQDKKKGETEGAMAARWVRTMRAKEHSTVDDALGALQQTTTVCQRCNGRSLNFSVLLALTLDMENLRPSDPPATAAVSASSRRANQQPQQAMKKGGAPAVPSGGLSLEDLLCGAFGRADVVSGYSCERCKECDSVTSTTALKTATIVSYPPTLVIHIKRFTWDGRKVTKPVAFPPTLTVPAGVGVEVPDICEAMGRVVACGSGEPRSQQQRPRYQLVATISHHGRGLDSGHYTAKVRARHVGERDPEDPASWEGDGVDDAALSLRWTSGRFFCCDDETVSLLAREGAAVDDDDAYILIYRRCMPWEADDL